MWRKQGDGPCTVQRRQNATEASRHKLCAGVRAGGGVAGVADWRHSRGTRGATGTIIILYTCCDDSQHSSYRFKNKIMKEICLN